MEALLYVALCLALGFGCFCLIRHWLDFEKKRAKLLGDIPGKYYPYRMVDSELQPILESELKPEDACCVTIWQRPLVLSHDTDTIEFHTEYKKPCRKEDWYSVYVSLLPHVKQQKVTGEGSRPPRNTKEGALLPAKHTWLVQPDGTVLWTTQSKDSGDVFYWVKDPKTGWPPGPSPRSKRGGTM